MALASDRAWVLGADDPQVNVVGNRGEGWKISNTTLKYERSSLSSNGEGTFLRLVRLINDETVSGVPVMSSPIYRDRLMRLQARMLTMKYHTMRMLTCNLKGEAAALVAKLENCQLPYDMVSLGIDVMGELGVLYDHTKYECERGYWQSQAYFLLGLIIGGGTAQIQKNIIWERGLGLPRESKPAKA